jgi:hypothetical protein
MSQPSQPADFTPGPYAGPFADDLYNKLIKPLAGVTGIDKLAGVVGAFFSVITNPRMWRSVGWFLMGLVLFVIGIFELIKHSGSFRKATAVAKNLTTDQEG